MARTHQTQQPPDRLARLRPDAQPVLGPARVELYILVALLRRRGDGEAGDVVDDTCVQRARRVSGERDAWERVICAEDFHGLGVACCPAGEEDGGVSGY